MIRGISIRARLLIGMVLLVSIGLAVANVTGTLLLRSYLLDRVDAQVTRVLPSGGATPPQGQTPPTGQTTRTGTPDVCVNPRDPRGLRSDFVLQVYRADGTLECSLGPDLGSAAPKVDQQQLTSGELLTVRSADGSERWRVRSDEIPATGQRMVLAVSLADADATVARLAYLSALVSGLVLLLTAAAAWFIARLGLQPLRRIEATAERIAAGDLSQRVPTFRPRTEVGRLSLALNGMLGQIERAFNDRAASEERLRRFISDASHELRTPVAAVRGHAEMWRSGIQPDQELVMSRIESESKRMGDLVDDMLLLARLDQARPLEREPVDLLSLAAHAVIDAQALQPDRAIELRADTAAYPPIVLGDDARLHQVLANLMTNALAHTPVTSAIDVWVRTDATRVEVTVSDEGPGMPPETVERAFDRFYRADPARTREHGGTGLGLSIARSLVEAHDGTLACASSPDAGTTFTITLPLGPDVTVGTS